MASDPEVLLDLITGVTVQRYAKDTTQSPPLVFACRDNLVQTIIQLDFRSPTTKRMSADMARITLRKEKADASVFLSEGWVVLQDADGNIDIETPASQQLTRRIEVLMLEVSMPGRHVTAIFEMMRDSTGKFLNFKELKRMVDGQDGFESHSRFDFFNQ